jgi:acyl phosphate:glycerol-3-phosphate acyltransferase
MDPRLIILALVAYLLGSIPFGYILVKLFLKQDIRQTGSGNIGATNVARSGKKGLAIATLLLDATKGFAAVAAARVIFPAAGEPGHSEGLAGLAAVLAALFAVLGHCFPVWLRFRGGKGVATAIGAFVAVAAVPSLIAVVSFALTFAITRYVSLGSVVGSAVFPVAAFFSLQPAFRMQILGILILTSAIIILKHHANIRRLIAGTEPKFGVKAAAEADPMQTEKNL